MPLTKDRDTVARDPALLAYPIAAGVKIFAGALVVLSAAGFLQPGTTALGLRAVGRAEDQYDNTGGAAGAITGTARRGVYFYKNSVADPIAQADCGNACFVADDETVAKTNGANTRSQAGIVRNVEVNGVWVEF